jgi:hypothetical protein
MAEKSVIDAEQAIDEIDSDMYDGLLLADGFDAALIGVGFRFTHAVAIYDKQACLRILETRDKMSPDEAEEFFDFNVAGAFVGEQTPVYVEQWIGTTRRH